MRRSLATSDVLAPEADGFQPGRDHALRLPRARSVRPYQQDGAMAMGPVPGRAPSAPSLRGRSLVLWIGDHHGGVLDDPGLDVAGTVAMSLSNVARNRGALRRAR